MIQLVTLARYKNMYLNIIIYIKLIHIWYISNVVVLYYQMSANHVAVNVNIS